MKHGKARSLVVDVFLMQQQPHPHNFQRRAYLHNWTKGGLALFSRGNRGNKQEQNSLKLQLAAEKRKMGEFSTPEAHMGRSMGVPQNSSELVRPTIAFHTDVSGHDDGHYITGADGRNVGGGDAGSAHQRSSGALESSCFSSSTSLLHLPSHAYAHTRLARNSSPTLPNTVLHVESILGKSFPVFAS